jgi:hypothetical protein
MNTTRWDETWHRLREWTNDQAPSERLAAQILLAEGFVGLDPSHPLGGKDGGKDALCSKDGIPWAMGVYFPRGQQTFGAIKKKYLDDLDGARANGARGFAFVTNQELMLAERRELVGCAGTVSSEIYHLERVTTLLDSPLLAATRKQFLGIDYLEDPARQIAELREEMLATQKRLEGIQTGGDSYCYFMLYHFDLQRNIAQNIVLIRKGAFPLYDLRIRIVDVDVDTSRNVFQRAWGELNSPADVILAPWPLAPSVYYRIFFHARNGAWNQDLILRKSQRAQCWLAATKVMAANGSDVRFVHTANEFESEFGAPTWRR